MTTPRTLTVKNPTDLLAMVPYVLGFHPDDSLVMLTVGEAAHRFHARVDLPVEAGDVDEVVANLVGVAVRHRVASVALVVYTDDECLAVAVCRPLREQFARAQIDVAVAIRADGSCWYSLTGCTGGCCPAEGTPYDVASHRFTAESVLDGRVTLGSRRELSDSLIGVDLDDIDAAAQAADQAMARFEASLLGEAGVQRASRARAHLVAEGQWVAGRVQQFLTDGLSLATEEIGRMAVAMIAIEVRDVAWAEMDRENSIAHVALWRDVVRRIPLDLVAAPAALLGFAAWLSGDGALAWCAVERCQQSEPDYSLAQLLTQALSGALPPSAWEPLDRRNLSLFAG